LSFVEVSSAAMLKGYRSLQGNIKILKASGAKYSWLLGGGRRENVVVERRLGIYAVIGLRSAEKST
jgi:hypothetical protein